MSEVELRARVQSGLEVLASLERAGATTATALILPAQMPYDQYEALGVALGRAHRTVTWMLADWLIYGESTYPERFAQAAEETNLAPQTLLNYASVARRVPPERRIPGIPFGVHAEVASLEPGEQTEWLERARDNGWKRDELRSKLRPKPVLPPAVANGADLENAAREVVRLARRYGDDFLVGKATFTELCAALGEET